MMDMVAVGQEKRLPSSESEQDDSRYIQHRNENDGKGDDDRPLGKRFDIFVVHRVTQGEKSDGITQRHTARITHKDTSFLFGFAVYIEIKKRD